MTELERITREIHRMYHGGAWHGPALMDVLRDVTAEQAAARPVPGAHTIYELTHHLAAWVGEVRERIGGKPPGAPPEGDFPPANTKVDAAAWDAVRERLAQRHRELIEALTAFSPARLDDPVDPTTERRNDGGDTYYALLQGMVQHNAYHAGQIMLLRKGWGAS